MIRFCAHGVNRGGSRSVRPGIVRGGALACALGFAVGVAGGGRPAWAGQAHAWGLLADSLPGLGASADVDQSHVGVLAVSLDRGDTLLASSFDRRFIPASNLKLFTTGAFLKQLGPEARGVTEIAARGKVRWKRERREVELKGDLTLRGSGFPDVVQLLSPGSRGLIDSLAYLLRQSGLVKFEGTLRVDGTLFAPEPFGTGWAIDDLLYSYGAPLNAIMANGNAAAVVATAGERGVDLALHPPETPLRISGRVTLAEVGTAPSLLVSRDPGSDILRVSGQVPRGGTVVRHVATPDPDSTAGLVLLGAMRRLGIEVRAEVRVVAPNEPPDPPRSPGGWPGVRPEEAATVVSLDSPRASDIASAVSAYSLNAESEALLRLLDPAPRGKSGSQGVRRLMAILAEAGVDTLDLSLVDGSGLSPLNLATPRSFVRWLSYLDRDPALGGVFRASLAVPGGFGTLQKRLPGVNGASDMHAKTGTLTNVSALSGYLMGAGGERIVFSIMSNGNRGSVSAARAMEEAIVGLLARFRRPPPATTRPPVGIPR